MIDHFKKTSRQAIYAIVFASLSLACYAETNKVQRILELPRKPFPEVMVKWTLSGGCFFYSTGRADYFDELQKYKQVYEWSGECIAGKPLEGPGELLGLSINFNNEHIPDDYPSVGKMVNGRWDGAVYKGQNSYTYRNGCAYEYLCRDLFNSLDASLGEDKKISDVSQLQAKGAPEIKTSLSAPTARASLAPNVKFAKDGRPTKGVKSFGGK